MVIGKTETVEKKRGPESSSLPAGAGRTGAVCRHYRGDRQPWRYGTHGKRSVGGVARPRGESGTVKPHPCAPLPHFCDGTGSTSNKHARASQTRDRGGFAWQTAGILARRRKNCRKWRESVFYGWERMGTQCAIHRSAKRVRYAAHQDGYASQCHHVSDGSGRRWLNGAASRCE